MPQKGLSFLSFSFTLKLLLHQKIICRGNDHGNRLIVSFYKYVTLLEQDFV